MINGKEKEIMFCGKCGKEIPGNVSFCPSCGAPVAQDAGVAGNGQGPQKTKSPLTGGGKKKVGKPAIAVLCAAAVICIIAVLFVTLRQPSINLDKYVQVEFGGYNGYGTASLELDYDALYEENRDKLGNNSDSLFYADEFLVFCIDGKLDVSNGLSNGDTVTLEWDCDDDAAQETFGVELKYSDLEFEVEGLEEPEVFDPFEGVEVVFTGTAPAGKAEIVRENTSEAQDQLNYSLDVSTGLSNGDEVTVTISRNLSADLEQYLVENYGVIPSATEKTYTVSGLESYVQSISEITDTAMEKIHAQAEDVFVSSVASKWADEATFDDMQYYGAYLLTNKNPDSYGGDKNRLYVIYTITSTINASNSRETEFFNQTTEYYWYIRYDNLIVGTDGEIIIDITDYTVTWDTFRVRAENMNRSWQYYGYPSLDELDYAVITVNRESYNSEMDVVGTEAAEAVTSTEAPSAEETTAAEDTAAEEESETAEEESSVETDTTAAEENG